MQRALMMLGYHDIHHGFALFANPCETEYWREGIEAKYSASPSRPPFGRAEFDQLLGHCAACCDYPSNVFGPELVAAYPDAKVVLVERDADAWFRSFDESIIQTMYHPLWRYLAALGARYVAEVDALTTTWAKHAFKATTRDEFRANARDTYREHYRAIRAATPPERLLEYDLRDGWEPLCAFLGRPVPDVPFPHINDRETFHEKLMIIMKKAAKTFARKVSYVAVPGLVAATAYYLMRDGSSVSSSFASSGLAGLRGLSGLGN